jgi:hypothetical protein
MKFAISVLIAVVLLFGVLDVLGVLDVPAAGLAGGDLGVDVASCDVDDLG